MTIERELLSRALEVLDEKVIGYEITKGVIRAYLSTPSDEAKKPVGYQWLHSGHFRKQIPKNANVIEWYPLYIHPPKPAEPELYEALKKFVADSREHDVGGGDVVITTCESRELAQAALAKVKPAEPEAESKTEIQDWMKPHPKCDEACMYSCTLGFTKFPECTNFVHGVLQKAEPARKPMTDEEMEKRYEIDKEYFGESVMRAFYNGVRFAEKHHDITDADV